MELRSGQRAALNLIGDTDALTRGVTLTSSGGLCVTTRARVAIELLSGIDPLKDRQRIRFLVGTQEVIGRVQLLAEDNNRKTIANLLFESPVVVVWGDHFVLRRYSPLETLGGGVVLEPIAPRFTARNLASEIEAAKELHVNDLSKAILAFVRWRGRHGIRVSEVAIAFGLPVKDTLEIAQQSAIVEFAGHLILEQRLIEMREQIKRRLTELHKSQPDRSGFGIADLKAGILASTPEELLQQLVEKMVSEAILNRQGNLLSIGGVQVALTPEQTKLHTRILELLKSSGFSPPSADVIAQNLRLPKPTIEKSLVLMDRLGKCRRLGLDLFFETERFNGALGLVRDALRDGKQLSISDVGKMLESSRKYVVPFLEYLDGKGITMRQDNVRVRGRNLDT
jgi:selenocysteine-specific elongation factor